MASKPENGLLHAFGIGNEKRSFATSVAVTLTGRWADDKSVGLLERIAAKHLLSAQAIVDFGVTQTRGQMIVDQRHTAFRSMVFTVKFASFAPGASFNL